MKMKLWNRLRVAFSFLTILPVPAPRGTMPDDFGRSAAWFSITGLVIGLILALVGWGTRFIFPAAVVGFLVTGVWALITGGLHLDGLADCCDGMMSAAGIERRLEIMKDPRLGTFGGAGLVLVLLGKFVLSTVLVERGIWLAFPLAASLGRWFILLAARQPSARPGGMGDAFARGVRPWHIILSFLIPLGIMLWAGPVSWISLAAALLVLILIITAARRRLGGMTGDVFGLIVEMSELTVLLGMSIRSL